MKKIFTLCAAVLFAAGLLAQSYGILVNGTSYYAGEQVAEFDGFTQYLAHVPVVSGDRLQLCDYDNKATWVVSLDGASQGGFIVNEDHYDVTAEGCFDFYIKLKYQQDQLYIGQGTAECGEGVPYSSGSTPGGDPQPGSGAKDYFLKGFCNGADITTPTAEEQFEEGILSYTFTGDDNHLGYFFILVCEQGQVVGDCYMTSEFTTDSHCTLVKEDATHVQKLAVQEGTVTFYLYDNGDGSLELSTEPLAGKTLVGTQTQGIENTTVNKKAHKAVIDGRLVIIRGDKMFDVTGKQL